MELSKQAQKEINTIKHNMYTIFKSFYDKTLVCFERYMRLPDNKSHMVIHCVPIDLNKTENFQQKFENGVRSHRMEFFNLKLEEEISDFVTKEEYYFYLELVKKSRYCYAFGP